MDLAEVVGEKDHAIWEELKKHGADTGFLKTAVDRLTNLLEQSIRTNKDMIFDARKSSNEVVKVASELKEVIGGGEGK
jgi:hypothetical protein